MSLKRSRTTSERVQFIDLDDPFVNSSDYDDYSPSSPGYVDFSSPSSPSYNPGGDPESEYADYCPSPVDYTDYQDPDPKDSSAPQSYLDIAVEKVLTCPITQSRMEDPVVASDGHTYSRAAIEEWILTCKKSKQPARSPCTNLPLKTKVLTPNLALASLLSSL